MRGPQASAKLQRGEHNTESLPGSAHVRAGTACSCAKEVSCVNQLPRRFCQGYGESIRGNMERRVTIRRSTSLEIVGESTY